MEILLSMGTAVSALAIFCCRIIDVSLGTVRTISLVHGRIGLAVVLGFFEVLVWIAVISSVMAGVKENPVLLLAYAAGFAAGNGVGIAIERRLAIGNQVIRFISHEKGRDIAASIRQMGQAVTTFRGEGRDGPVDLLYVTCTRKHSNVLIDEALRVDPQCFYVTEPATSLNRRPFVPPHPTGWRAIAKKK